MCSNLTVVKDRKVFSNRVIVEWVAFNEWWHTKGMTIRWSFDWPKFKSLLCICLFQNIPRISHLKIDGWRDKNSTRRTHKWSQKERKAPRNFKTGPFQMTDNLERVAKNSSFIQTPGTIRRWSLLDSEIWQIHYTTPRAATWY